MNFWSLLDSGCAGVVAPSARHSDGMRFAEALSLGTVVFWLGFMASCEASASGYAEGRTCPDAQFASPRGQWFDGWPWYHPQWIHPDDDNTKARRRRRIPERPSWCAYDWPDSAIPKPIRDQYRLSGGYSHISSPDCTVCIRHLPYVLEFATETCVGERAVSMRVVWQLTIAKGLARPEFKVLRIVSFPRRLSMAKRSLTVKCLEALAAQRVYWSEYAECTVDIWAQLVQSHPGKYVAHTAWCAPSGPDHGSK